MVHTCPSCHHALTPVPTTSGSVMLVCQDCGGRSVTIATLSKVLSALTFKRLLTAYKGSHRLSERRCPVCTAKMRQVTIDILGKAHFVEICGKSELAWFDSHEFENLPLVADAEDEVQLPVSVQHALNQIEVQHGRVIANRTSFRLDASDFGFGWDNSEPAPSGWKFLLGLFLIPVEREHYSATKPWATWALLIAVFFVSVLGFSSGELIESLALVKGELGRWNGLTLLTYFFVHGSWMHLLGNMYYLWLFGDNVEEDLGREAYLAVVVFGTVGAGLVHAFFDPSSMWVLVGASGGISTLQVIYLLRFPRAKFGFFLLLGWLRVPAYIPIAIWIVMQVSLAYDQIAGLTKVSALAHLGGALVGLAAFFLLRKDND